MKRLFQLLLGTFLLQSVTSDDLSCRCTSSSVWNDVMIVVESSESTSNQKRKEINDVIHSISKDFNVQRYGHQSTLYYLQCGLFEFSSSVRLSYPLGTLEGSEMRGMNLSFEGNTHETSLEKSLQLAAVELSNFQPTRRKNSRKVILLIATSDIGSLPALQAANQFREDNGIIILYDLSSSSLGLSRLVSPGYHILSNSTNTLKQALCSANCFCRANQGSFQNDERKCPIDGCLFSSPLQMSFPVSSKQCARSRGYISSDKNREMTEYLHSMFLPASTPIAIGLKYNGTNGKWMWQDGKELSPSYAPWSSPPSTTLGLDCVFSSPPSPSTASQPFLWYQTDCRTSYAFVCQIPPCDSERYCEEDV